LIAGLIGYLTTIAEAGIVLALLAWTIHSFLKVVGGPGGSKGFDNYILNFLTSTLTIFAKFVLSAEGQLANIASAVATAFGSSGASLQAQFRTPIANLVRTELDLVRTQLTGAGVSTPQNAENMAANAMAEAFGFGAASAAATAVFEAAIPEKLNTLNGVGPMLAQMAGFAEIAGAVREPLYNNAFGKSLEYYYRGLFKPEYPDETDAVLWHARQLISDTQLRTIFNYSGLKAEYENAFVTSAYRGISPFVMIRLLDAGVFTDADARNELTFSGLRPQSQDRLITAGHYLAAEPFRKQTQAAYETMYEEGLLTDGQLTNNIDSTRHTNDIDQLMLLRAQVLKVVKFTREYVTAYTDLIIGGLIDLQTFQSDLQLLGYQQDAINARSSVVEARMAASAHKYVLAAERRLQAQTIAAARRAALENYKSGTIDLAAYTAALIATNMTAAQAAAFADLAYLQKQGNTRFLYGLQIKPDAAQLLRERVAALTDQRKKSLIDDVQFLAALTQLGIPSDVQNALLAAAAAQTTPKTAVTWVPVQT